MTSVIAALEAFIAKDDSWHPWMSVVVRPDLPLLEMCRTAVGASDDETLRRCGELLQTPVAADRLFNAFASHVEFASNQSLLHLEPGKAIDTDRFLWLILATIRTARLAIRLRGAFPSHTFESLASALQSHLAKAYATELANTLEALGHAGCGQQTLFWWLTSFLGIERASHTRVPIASITDGNRGMITHLNLSAWQTPCGLVPALVPDLEAALTPMRTDLLDALARVTPPALARSISWHVVRPDKLRSTHLGGNSLQGAAAVALRFVNGGEPFHPGILILASVDDERLQPVGHEYPKLLAAIESFDRGRTSRYAAEEANSVQKVIFAAESRCDRSPADERGLPCVRLARIDDAVEVVREATRDVADTQYLIVRSLRKIVAVNAENPEGYTVDTSSGPISFGLHSRIDYISEVHFDAANCLREPYTLHYRARANGSLVEAECHPYQDNLFHDDVAYESYLELKKYYMFRLKPSADATYRMHARIFNGFGQSRRNMHFHFPDNAFHHLIEFELDLSVYFVNHPAFSISELSEHAPKVGIWRSQNPELVESSLAAQDAVERARRRRESACDRFCDLARNSPRLQPCFTETGVWRWQIENVRFGAVLWADWENTLVEKEES